MPPDTARCSQLAAGRAFVYITHQRRGVTLFASRELSPIGVGKRRLATNDPVNAKAQALISALLRHARAARVPNAAVNAAFISRFVAPAAQEVGVEAVFLPRTPVYSARVLITVGGAA